MAVYSRDTRRPRLCDAVESRGNGDRWPLGRPSAGSFPAEPTSPHWPSTSRCNPRSGLPDHHQVSRMYLSDVYRWISKVAALPRVWGRHPPAPWKHAYGIWPIVSVSNDATNALFQPTLSRCDRLIRLLSTSNRDRRVSVQAGIFCKKTGRDETKQNETRGGCYAHSAGLGETPVLVLESVRSRSC